MDTCKRCVVHGTVQGVFFRQGTKDKAVELGITGWVRNNPNGTVECVICGDSDAMEEMSAWLWQGPASAKVVKVDEKDEPLTKFQSFEIRY